MREKQVVSTGRAPSPAARSPYGGEGNVPRCGLDTADSTTVILRRAITPWLRIEAFSVVRDLKRARQAVKFNVSLKTKKGKK